ncbi:thiolase [Exidia glandulosa HHB12029]|uniref:acetyl-CoA C-acetyltransferase n=1 Tax=Exidia glandulosa HHB12029 TaxID=1314781 RepID=A0A165BXN0_EXIGL|nr:thiolase [Exidia glandulosa HHB12029]
MATRRALAPNDVVILAASRTPVGSIAGTLKSFTAPQLGIVALQHALSTIPTLPPSSIEELVFGNVVQAGVGQAPARQVVIGAGLDVACEATTVNKVCASGMKAIALAAQGIRLGERNVVVAGGMESMSNAPFLIPRTNPPFGHMTVHDTLPRDGLNDVYANVPMGVCAEGTAKKFSITREMQDIHAAESYRRAAGAWASGVFDAEIAPVTVAGKKGSTGTVVREDEEYKRVVYDKIPTLKPVFVTDGTGTITPANASPLNDGASALILTSYAKAQELGITPLARILSYAEAAVNPSNFIEAPTLAVPIALTRAGLTKADIALWEFNEAFSVAIRTVEKILELDPGKVNVNGGAVALGHALGNSGSRIVVSLVHALESGEYGVAGICNGGGGGSALVVEKL